MSEGGVQGAKDEQAIKSAALSQIKSRLAKAANGEGDADTPRQLTSLDDERKRAETDDLRTDTRLRKHYARWFIGILIGQLVLMNVIFVCVGVGVLKFTDYALHLYMGGTLAEVFGIVYVITRYLFPKRV